MYVFMRSMTKEKMAQNLRDAGCEEVTILAYFQAIESGDKKSAMRLIAAHREKLLEQFHKSCSCIDCLDYFVTQTEELSSR